MAIDVDDLLDRASSVLGELADLDLDQVGDEGLERAVLKLQELRGRLEVGEARVLDRWNTAGIWRPSGAQTAAAWITAKQRIPVQVARQRLRHGRTIRTFPAIARDWAQGTIDRTHVTTLLGLCTRRTQPVWIRDLQMLLEMAGGLPFNQFKVACAVWASFADPDGVERGSADERDAREFHYSQSFRGHWFGRLDLDRVSGDIVNTTLRRIERELFGADWAEAKDRLGRDPRPDDLHRTPAQRRADALVEMAIRARTEPAGGRRPAPLFTVVVDYPTLAGRVCELWNRTALTPGSLVPWLPEAEIERVVFDGRSRVVDVGARRRLFRGALRRGIEVRDRICFHEMCDKPPERSEIDHIHEAAKGGLTTQDNGRLACRFHNQWRLSHPDDPDPPSVP
ncbi:MAG: HNH endonuclease [Actinomycetota bacterium]|nr:HNH endonuclease [Actinomycetota bacterium]